MNSPVAALPMYDWPEMRAETDAQWAALRDRLRSHGIEAPERLVRCNADLPAVPGGIRDASGVVIAPDPAMLAPDEFDLHALWQHPALLLAQTCWGPMGQGLAAHVQVVGQPDYSAFEGGEGEFYSSAIVMRGRGSLPSTGNRDIPLDRLRGRRFICNSLDSMSGVLALTADLEAMGETLDIFSERSLSGGHRASVLAIAEGRADVAAIDCRSWAMARQFEPAARELAVVGWTARRKGLPFIAARTTPFEVVAALSEILRS